MAKNPTENVSIAVDANVLSLVDHLSCALDLTRSQIFNRAVKLYLCTQLTKEPSFWEAEYQRLQKKGKV